MPEKSVTICYWGSAKTVGESWLNWLDACDEISAALNAPLTHIGVKAAGFSSKALEYSRTRQKLKDAARSGREISRISVYSMPDVFETVAFDYMLHATKSSRFVAVSVSGSISSALLSQKDNIAKILSCQLDQIERTEIFSLTKDEVPMMYVMGAMDANSMKGFKLFQKFP